MLGWVEFMSEKTKRAKKPEVIEGTAVAFTMVSECDEMEIERIYEWGNPAKLGQTVNLDGFKPESLNGKWKIVGIAPRSYKLERLVKASTKQANL